ncbi:hypothetical protein [Dyadobacter sp. MSC1_007]|jgi:hypothetical protein|uniref:hypothetical protein n=1 Tax=Dyadobacter sp. MSC1_007 TaxID=2909264 RepID=UPI00202FA106|nr:hypothetical protein [Dyadobacter sp. MSC1_007]
MRKLVKRLFLLLVCALTIILTDACKEKDNPEVPSVIYGREGDTCQLSKITVGTWDYLRYDYTNRTVRKVTLHTQNADFPCELIYSNGRLQRVSGKIMDTSYEYDAKGRVIKENRTLHNDDVNTLIPHFGARIFEYNDADQVVKCSYVEGRGTEYNSFYVKKGEIYRYETYAYDVQGDVFGMVAYEREAKSEKFKVTADYTFFHDKLISPFYGHPGIFDFNLYFGNESGNGPAVFSKHNIVRRVENGISSSTTYTYTGNRYPLKATHFPWTDNFFVDDIRFEYLNCK